LISPLHCNAPCWIRTSDRLLGRLAVVGLKTLAVTGFVGPKLARCEQKCEQFAGFGPPGGLSSGSWEGVIAVCAMPQSPPGVPALFRVTPGPLPGDSR
jgi:hypothetical protein